MRPVSFAYPSMQPRSQRPAADPVAAPERRDFVTLHAPLRAVHRSLRPIAASTRPSPLCAVFDKGLRDLHRLQTWIDVRTNEARVIVRTREANTQVGHSRTPRQLLAPVRNVRGCIPKNALSDHREIHIR